MQVSRWNGAALAAIMVAALTACSSSRQPASTADTSRVADAVNAIMRELQSTWNAHDAERHVSHNAPSIVLMNHGEANTVGADAVLASVKRAFAAGPSSISLSNPVVDVAQSGEMAVYRANYVDAYTDAATKRSATEFGNVVAGFKKQPDGAWKIAWIVYADTPPAETARQ